MSEMNANILKKEFHLLSEELKSYQQENKQVSMPAEMGFGGGIFENQKMSGFTLNEKMFEVESESIGDVVNSNLALKDSIKDNINKRTVSSLSFSKRVNYPNYIKTSEQRPSNESTKTERTQKIIDIIKDTSKKLGNASGDGVSIKEVSAFFKDCSEKTIQRELNDLVSKNKIKKIGAKRWSRYLPV
jgi:predicted HTH transcriptional regulator